MISFKSDKHRYKNYRIVFFLLSIFISFTVHGQGVKEGIESFESKNYHSAFDILMPFAEQGDPDAQEYIANMYRFGYGVENDNEEAARWYKKSAYQGNPLSLINLDIIYSQGLAGSDEEIFEWSLYLAEEGKKSKDQPPGRIFLGAQYNTGLFYIKGKGVPQNISEGLRWLRLAEENSYDPAKYFLALEYAKGDILEKNMREAINRFEVVAKSGDARAQYLLGSIYSNGDGVPQNYETSAYWMEKSSRQGFSSAQVGLAIMYIYGRGVEENFVMAYILLSLSAAQGDTHARSSRDELLNFLSREQVNEGQRIASEWTVGSELPSPRNIRTWP
ncbi:sel1 repeat family protein [Halomonas sp. ANAO-440]|uniref:tetratricopeptide repeat protein n=1 Tax=Halomonas sp. ANAO-440 TaxID=2861360 RepID=UPI001CAA6FDA|nr:tetratricopeptide repeat protein [Halomonas sp. ANAO-440]MBZ0330994.1 sel1 repeat family protein [Halomonas sp. ANAO-440]